MHRLDDFAELLGLWAWVTTVRGGSKGYRKRELTMRAMACGSFVSCPILGVICRHRALHDALSSLFALTYFIGPDLRFWHVGQHEQS